MEHPFFATAATRAEALRWLAIAEKLLSARDLLGSKSFATRARDSDPTLSAAEEILAVVDTLLAGDRPVANNQLDCYGILRLTPPQGHDAELVASRYRGLVHLLNPQRNKFPFAEQALRLVVEAWSVLSNYSRKSLYDKELAFYSQSQHHQPDPFSEPMPTLQQQSFIFFGGGPASSSVAQPQVHGCESSGIGASHYAQVHQQVHAQPQVEPMVGGSSREPQTFMNFSSSSDFVFGFGSGSKSSHEPVANLAQESYSTFAGNMASASGGAQEQLGNKQKQSQENYASAIDRAVHEVGLSEDLGETMEDEEVEEKMDVEEDVEEAEQERVDSPVNEREDDGSPFWTACPYCYYMYEYPRMYADCTLRCQNCKKAFQAVVIPSPPPIMDGQEANFCCWGFLPFGFSMEKWEKNKGPAPAWTPFSPISSYPVGVNKRGAGQKSSASRVYVDLDDDEDFAEISSSSESDDDWRIDRNKIKKKKMTNAKGKETTGTPKRSALDNGKNVNAQDTLSPHGVGMPNTIAGGASEVGAVATARKQPSRVAKNFGKLDLNVELINEVEEPTPRTNQGNAGGGGVDDNIEGNGFFEGLDEFLSNLPILNVVGDDKVVKAA